MGREHKVIDLHIECDRGGRGEGLEDDFAPIEHD